jgi:hypothetical protein
VWKNRPVNGPNITLQNIQQLRNGDVIYIFRIIPEHVRSCMVLNSSSAPNSCRHRTNTPTNFISINQTKTSCTVLKWQTCNLIEKYFRFRQQRYFCHRQLDIVSVIIFHFAKAIYVFPLKMQLIPNFLVDVPIRLQNKYLTCTLGLLKTCSFCRRPQGHVGLFVPLLTVNEEKLNVAWCVAAKYEQRLN